MNWLRLRGLENQGRINPRFLRPMVLASCLFILLLTMIIGIQMLFLRDDVFLRGIFVENIHLGGKKLDEAYPLIKNAVQSEIGKAFIEVSTDGYSRMIRSSELDIIPQIDDTIEYAFSIGKKGNIFSRINNGIKLILHPEKVTVPFYCNVESLESIWREIEENCTVPVQEPGISLKNGKPEITPERIGKSLYKDEFYIKVTEAVVERKWGKIYLNSNEIFPKVREKELRKINGELASSSTAFSPSDPNRVENIRLSAGRLNGMVLLPGEVFSMNEALGPRTLSNGYKEAKIILNNELVTGTGGGVCQVTTTLYRTVLLSLLEVVERRNHSLTLGYVEPGQDATIAEGYIDFKFKNNMADPIAIFTEVGNNTITVRIFGNTDNVEYSKIRLVSVVRGEIQPEKPEIIEDPDLEEGKTVTVREAQNGLKVDVYREYYKDGKLFYRELISQDTYSPVRAQIRVGTKKVRTTDEIMPPFDGEEVFDDSLNGSVQ